MCECNKPPKHWANLDFVKKMAQGVADIKGCSQVVFKTKTGYLFNDADTYQGTESIITIGPQQ